MNGKLSRPGVWARLTPLEREAFVRGLTQEERDAFVTDFRNYAHDGQLPLDDEWHVWLIMAGRGFGKTRAGAEWVRFVAEVLPDARIALVGASLGEARAVMVEGESGILACCPVESAPTFEPSLRRLSWPNGAQASLYSAAEPESLRGPQHSHAGRTGAEGVLRQRSVRSDRRPAPSGDRRRSHRTAGFPRAWRMLAGGGAGERCLGPARGRTGELGRDPVDLLRPLRRHAAVRQIDRRAGRLSRRMAADFAARRPYRGRGRRCRSAGGNCRS